MDKDVAAMAERQKRQIEELDKLQQSLNELKKRAGGVADMEGTLLSRVTGCDRVTVYRMHCCDARNQNYKAFVWRISCWCRPQAYRMFFSKIHSVLELGVGVAQYNVCERTVGTA
jgi:hypothetical protein